MHNIIDEMLERDMNNVVGDLNAMIGRNKEDMEDVMGKDGLGENVNENGAHFYYFLYCKQPSY